MGVHNINPLLFEEQHLVRVIEQSGDPWFAAPDICRILGIANVTQAVSRLDEDELTLITNEGQNLRTEGQGGPQAINFVSEPGVYRLLFTSRKPVAERMKRWLAHEVIPAIRRDGFYGQRRPELPALDAESRPFPEWPMEELRTKSKIVDTYRLTFGVQASQWIMPQMGFPMPPPELIEHRRQPGLFDDIAA